MRINATLVRTGPHAQPAIAADLRSQALAEVRAATEEGRSRRFIYDGLLSREQAARGAVIGQYVRIAQAEQEMEEAFGGGPTMVAGGDGFVRRDLIDTMFQQMTGELAGWPLGQRVATTI